jgi:hypothetical protein
VIGGLSTTGMALLSASLVASAIPLRLRQLLAFLYRVYRSSALLRAWSLRNKLLGAKAQSLDSVERALLLLLRLKRPLLSLSHGLLNNAIESELMS